MKSACFVVGILILCMYALFGKECNVLDYGAKGNGKTLDGKAIQKAIDSCVSNDSLNTILFPSNYNFLSYSFYIKYNNTQLLINSILTASNNISGWPRNEGGGAEPLISTFANYPLSNIIISGNGLINGQGQIWWELYKNGTAVHRPNLIHLNNIQQLNISYITLLNAPSFHIFVGESENVVIHNVNITSPDYQTAPNTDGIDIGSKNVHIYDCYVKNGDDSYCMKPGAENVLIENSTAVQGNSLVANSAKGSFQSQLPIKNILFRNIYCDKTKWGAHIKSGENEGNMYNGTFLNITFENITLNEVLNAININVFNESGYDKSVAYSKVDNITYRDIRGTYTNYAGHLDCSQAEPCKYLLFEDIDLKAYGTSNDTWTCSSNVYGTVNDVEPTLSCVDPQN